eukprot:gene11800-11945_t
MDYDSEDDDVDEEEEEQQPLVETAAQGIDAATGADEAAALSGDDASQGGSGDDDGDDGGDDDEGPQFDAAARGDQAGVGTSAAAAAAAADTRASEAEVASTGRFAGEAELSELFGTFGALEEVHLVTDKDTKRSRGIAYVKFVLPDDAVAAYRALDMTAFQGRLMHVLPAKRRPGEESAAAAAADEAGVEAQAGGSSFKKQRAAQRTADAGNRAAWSSLFMRADTVAEAVAAHYGVSKGQLLDAAAEDLPLRMALGEAQVIAETKAALGAAGINVSALEAAAAAGGAAASRSSVARSSTSLLVKNLPHTADDDELRQLLAGAGRTVVRLVLPPTKTLALVEFAEPQEARAAFKALAYKKYQHNLNFNTTDAALRKHFDKAVSAAGGQIHSAKVARRKGADEKLLSMGFGFVETDSEAAAKAAIQALQGSLLDKHKIQLQLSKRGAPGSASSSKAKAAAIAAAAAAGKDRGTKVVVRNVAFEATRKDLLGLFGPFGHIKSCRLPKKFDGNHRGFAFLEFTTKQEANNALTGVGGTHLYGRRLVVEYAQADDEAGIDDLRLKTAAKFAAGQAPELEGPVPKRLKRSL